MFSHSCSITLSISPVLLFYNTVQCPQWRQCSPIPLFSNEDKLLPYLYMHVHPATLDCSLVFLTPDCLQCMLQRNHISVASGFLLICVFSVHDSDAYRRLYNTQHEDFFSDLWIRIYCTELSPSIECFSGSKR